MRVEENKFFIEHKKAFSGREINPYHLLLSFEFAYEMCFGKGNHRDHRSGGHKKRKPIELFANTLQGKLAEFCVYQELKDLSTKISFPDLSIHGKGTWDSEDLEFKDQKISVKSTAFFSNLLLLESRDYNRQGGYIPNEGTVNDFTFLVRLKPDIKSTFKKARILYNLHEEKQVLKDLVFGSAWYYDIPGALSKIGLSDLISSKQILPQNALLNGVIKMDAENYYCEVGKLSSIKDLLEK